MARYIEVNTPKGFVFMEVDEGAEIMRKAGGAPVGPVDTAADRFRKSVDVLSHEAEEIIAKLRKIDLAPDEVTVSFGIKAAGEIGAPIFALAKGSVEAGYNITMKWKREESRPVLQPVNE